MKTNKLFTLNGERVKSFGELLIANFLYRNGINYKYEEYYNSKFLKADVNVLFSNKLSYLELKSGLGLS